MGSDLIDLARTLAGERLSGVPRRWTHVQGVADVAAEIAPRIVPIASEAIIAAAWLHDIGYAPTVAVTGFHPVDGARFAKDSGMPELVVSLIAHHTGADAEAAERGLAGDLAEFAPPPRDVLDVVTFADLTTSPDGGSISAERRITEILSRYDKADPVHVAVSRSAPELLASVARVYDRLELAPAISGQPR
ncbi:MAG TPA: HD domain-containing protein [Humibacter sp.]|jgi:putative nucleotidyltransferase with HDIG domain|nr:HD domain-containing protein [Humibacter sp.]